MYILPKGRSLLEFYSRAPFLSISSLGSSKVFGPTILDRITAMVRVCLEPVPTEARPGQFGHPPHGVDADLFDKSCWDGLPPAALEGKHNHPNCLLVAMRFPVSTQRNIFEKLTRYGHLFSVVERFMQCVVMPWKALATASLDVIVPAEFWYTLPGTSIREGTRDANVELATIFNGTEAPNSSALRLRVHRALTPICSPAGYLRDAPCCIANVTAQSRRSLALSTGSKHCSRHTPEIAQMRVLLNEESDMAQLREMAWANVARAPREPSRRPGLVLFLSSIRASNLREMADEDGVAAAVEKHYQHSRPELSFRRVRLLNLTSYADEIRLVQRAQVMISLFGSALHNFRFMQPGSLVVQLDDALKSDFFGAPLQYSLPCASMGLRWLGVPVPGGLPTATRLQTSALQFSSRGSDYMLARVNASELVRYLTMEENGQHAAALREYAMHVESFLHPERDHASRQRAVRWFVHQTLPRSAGLVDDAR